jgi:hypothetical protein
MIIGMMMKIRTYTELIKLKTFEERFEYLKLSGSVGIGTFGFDRYINQDFYRSVEWRHVRQDVIARDEACDLAILDRPIFSKILIHHMNPITIEDLENSNDIAIDPEFLIVVSHRTHNAIHFGNKTNLLTISPERREGDTDLWQRRY